MSFLDTLLRWLRPLGVEEADATALLPMRMPIRLQLLGQARDYATPWYAGAAWWNTQLGMRVFVGRGDESHHRSLALVTAAERPMDKICDHDLRIGEARVLSASIVFDPVSLALMQPAESRWACAHELGHLLGLAHDNRPSSVMHPIVGDSRRGPRLPEIYRRRIYQAVAPDRRADSTGHASHC